MRLTLSDWYSSLSEGMLMNTTTEALSWVENRIKDKIQKYGIFFYKSMHLQKNILILICWSSIECYFSIFYVFWGTLFLKKLYTCDINMYIVCNCDSKSKSIKIFNNNFNSCYRKRVNLFSVHKFECICIMTKENMCFS